MSWIPANAVAYWVAFVVFIVAFSAILTIVGYFMGYGLAGLWSRLQNREGRNG